MTRNLRQSVSLVLHQVIIILVLVVLEMNLKLGFISVLLFL